MIDVPFSGFNFHKDVKAALYKSVQFFTYCENSAIFKPCLKAFCSDLGVKDWRQYLAILLGLFHKSISSPYIIFDEKDIDAYHFLEQFSVDLKHIHEMGLWNHEEGLKYLRDHFTVLVSENTILIISPDFIVDKMYQGLKFMMFNSIVRNQLTHPNGKIFKDIGEFNSLLGNDFSEDHLVYKILTKSFKEFCDVFLSKEEMKNQGIKGETDFYIRIGEDLIMIEFKDVIINDKVKNSGDVELIKNTIFDRICKYDPKNKKGFGQLISKFENLCNGDYNKLDPSSTNVKRLFPVILTTDLSFSSLGVNAAVVQEACNIIESHDFQFGSRSITIPIIIDLDTIINISYGLSTGNLDIIKLFESYLDDNSKNLMPFRIYIMEKVTDGRTFNHDEHMFLFGEDLPWV